MPAQNPSLSLVFGIHSNSEATVKDLGSAASFFAAALPYAQQEYKATGVLTSVVLAQWSDEQGYRWPPMYNNPGNVGDPVSAGQVGYSTVEAGVEASIKTMLLPYYARVRSSVGYVAQSYALGQSPWAGGHYDADGGPPGTDLIKIIQANNLTKYDAVVPVIPTPAPIPVILKSLNGRIGNLNAPVVAVVPTFTGKGYTLVGADGSTFNYGDADFYGSLANTSLNAPIIDACRTVTGNGLYLVATDGGVFTFGDAVFYGSTGSLKLNEPIVSIAITKSGAGYWLTGADGGIFTYGDAQFLGTPA